MVARLYPALRFREQDGDVVLAGSVVVVQDCGEQDVVAVELRFPANYPEREPVTRETGRRFVRDGKNHINPDGTFCMWTPEESRWNAGDPDALERYLEHLVVHLDKQLVYEVTKKWPGDQRAHGDAGRDEALCEIAQCDAHAARIARSIVDSGQGVVGRKAPCPCGSGATYEKCHRREAVRAAGVLGCLPNAKMN